MAASGSCIIWAGGRLWRPWKIGMAPLAMISTCRKQSQPRRRFPLQPPVREAMKVGTTSIASHAAWCSAAQPPAGCRAWSLRGVRSLPRTAPRAENDEAGGKKQRGLRQVKCATPTRPHTGTNKKRLPGWAAIRRCLPVGTHTSNYGVLKIEGTDSSAK